MFEQIILEQEVGRASATHRGTHTSASPRESQEGGLGTGGLDGVRDQKCPVPAQPCE